MTRKNIPELLAPAGSMKALKASVNAGADAVYLSGKKFGARQFAPNFHLKEMEEAIKYAHIHGVRAYVTVNTLIKETELAQVGDHLIQLYSMGVDAIIVQDMGVARLARELIPQMDLHCSTQMTIHNSQGINWAEDNGFKRVILSREMSLREIKLTAKENKKRNIELEVFAHGAICYSYSGQCLLSSFIGGRSGNRGMCAQPCRKNYRLIMAKEGQYGRYEEIEEIPLKNHYLLSTKDLAIYSHLEEIVKSGLSSIKIEGRMKPPEYVANVVKIYRNALNSLANGKWTPDSREFEKLKMCFNRGLTDGWIFNRNSSVMGRESPGNRGLYLGKVTSYNKKHGETIIHRESDVKLEKGDGILFKDPVKTGASSDMWGTLLEYTPPAEKNKLLLKLRKRVKIGSKVFITRRKSMFDWAEKLIKDSSSPYEIPIKIWIKWDETFTPVVKVTASPPKLDKIKIEYKADFSMERAIRKPLSDDNIIKHLKKTGGTPFVIRGIRVDNPGNLFTPISNLNHLRREILKEVEKRILKAYQPTSRQIDLAKNHFHIVKKNLGSIQKIDSYRKPGEVNLAIYVSSNDALEAAVESGCKAIYYQPEFECQKVKGSYGEFFSLNSIQDYENYFKHVHSCLTEAKSCYNKTDFDLIWKWPDISSANFIKGATRLLKLLPENTIDGVMVGNVGAIWDLKQGFSSVKICGSEGLNIWNHMAIEEQREDLQSFTLSPELSQEQLENVISRARESYPGVEFQFLIQGNLKTMVSEDCLPCFLNGKYLRKKMKNIHLGIRDSRKRIFPVEIDQECRTHIFNSVELCLIDYLPELQSIGMDSLIVDARYKPADYVRNILSIYQEALNVTVACAPKLDDKLESLKKRVKKISRGGITTGNFVRGIEDD